MLNNIHFLKLQIQSAIKNQDYFVNIFWDLKCDNVFKWIRKFTKSMTVNESYEFIGLIEHVASALSFCRCCVISSWDTYFSKIIVKLCDCYIMKELEMQNILSGPTRFYTIEYLAERCLYNQSKWGWVMNSGVGFFLNVFLLSILRWIS